MISANNIFPRVAVAVTLVLAVALLTVPSALAGSGKPPYLSVPASSPVRTGQCPCNRDLPVGPHAPAAPLAASLPAICPCNRDLLRVSGSRTAASTFRALYASSRTVLPPQ